MTACVLLLGATRDLDYRIVLHKLRLSLSRMQEAHDVGLHLQATLILELEGWRQPCKKPP